jgi:SAM-dependent methyltransferase
MDKQAYFELRCKAGEKEIQKFWHRFGEFPQLAQKFVIDFGCGLGKFATTLARAGAEKVVGVDIYKDAIDFALKKLQSEPDLVRTRVEFRVSDLTDIASDNFDIAISKDVFEHVSDIDGAFNQIFRILKKGGKLYTAIGPLYASPFGFHNRWRSIFPWLGIQVPWLHLLFPERVLVNKWNKNYQKKAMTMKELGLNGLLYRDYLKAVSLAGFRIRYHKVNVGGRLLSKVFSIVRRARCLEDLFTYNIYLVLEKV